MEPNPGPNDLLIALLLVQSLLERRSESFFQPFGLTGAQFNILNLLAYRGGRMDQAALSDLLLVGKSSISIVLNRMVRASLVTREEHPKDRRQTVLVLTAKGRALWRKISPRYEASVEEVFGTLKKENRANFLGSLETLYGALRKSEKSPGAGDATPTLNEMLIHLTKV
jgi:DNA-binding MarR family transcriptional regulator